MMNPHKWLIKYYPIPADRVPIENSHAHSLRKWRGLYPSILESYGLHSDNGNITDAAGNIYLVVNDDTCALCVHYAETHEIPCLYCPLFLARGSIPCDHLTKDEKERKLRSPYCEFIDTGNPERMIYWLETALAAGKG